MTTVFHLWRNQSQATCAAWAGLFVGGKKGLRAFVDASQHPQQEEIIAGSYDFDALLARIEYAIIKTNANRVVVDSLSALGRVSTI